jgi:hypothetical protein
LCGVDQERPDQVRISIQTNGVRDGNRSCGDAVNREVTSNESKKYRLAGSNQWAVVRSAFAAHWLLTALAVHEFTGGFTHPEPAFGLQIL